MITNFEIHNYILLIPLPDILLFPLEVYCFGSILAGLLLKETGFICYHGTLTNIDKISTAPRVFCLEGSISSVTVILLESWDGHGAYLFIFHKREPRSHIRKPYERQIGSECIELTSEFTAAAILIFPY
jgi:hypothetical protein